MKTLLYITVNSKPEHSSACKSVGRVFVNEFKAKYPDYEINEFDLYDISIPKLKCQYFNQQSSLVDVNDSSLSKAETETLNRIIELAQEFKAADFYVFAVPLWNMLFPSPLKEYLDCVIQNDITVKVSPDKITGLLSDKKRIAVYIQSSGGPVPWIIEGKVSHGTTYIKDILKFIGITEYYEILVDKTGYTEKEQQKAIDKGIKQVKTLVKKL
jgi:FMN-dependent NADH-azoreductase